MADETESTSSYQPQSYSSAQHAAIPERIAHWRKELLKDMAVLPKIRGHRAGRIVVYGNQAVPILSGVRSEHVVIAAAEYGPKHGRVVVVSQHRYLAHFCTKNDQENVSILQENINHWVTKGAFANKKEVQQISGKQDLVGLEPGTKILIWDSNHHVASPELEDAVFQFLENGGGLVYGVCPHKWSERNRKKTMEEIPFQNVLAKLGIGFCSNKIPYASPQGFGIDKDLLESQLALCHGQYLVHACSTETDGVTLQQHTLKFVHFFRDAPAGLIKFLKEKLNALFTKCRKELNDDYHIPEEDNKLTDLRGIAVVGLCSVLSELELGYDKIPGIEHFPRDVGPEAEVLKGADLTIKSQGREAHPTGYWVLAGQKCHIRIISQMNSGGDAEDENCSTEEESETEDDEDFDGWSLRIGSHSDTLYHKDTLKRWPNLVVKAPLKSEQVVFTPYGGLLYLFSPRTMSSVSVQMSGVVEAPYFDLKDTTTVESWETVRTAPGPWADICGQWFRISVPSAGIRELKNPTQVMKVWDNIVLQNHELRGTRPGRREWLVADVQPVVGKMHSGYPLVASMNVTEPDGALSYERLTTVGFWGIFHELGHNMQRNMWTFEGTREVTCNIFALYAADHTSKQPVWIHKWLARHLDRIKDYLDDGADFSEWQAQCGVALGVYAQFAHHFGWQIYKRVFWRYEVTPLNRRPLSTQGRIDEWFLRFSDAVGYNLVPMAEFWGIPMSSIAQQKLRPLKPFVPDDELTRLGEKRIQVLLKKYPNMVRVVDKERLKLDKHWCPLV